MKSELKDLRRGIHVSAVLSLPDIEQIFEAARTHQAVIVELVSSIHCIEDTDGEQIADTNDHTSRLVSSRIRVDARVETIRLENVRNFNVSDGGFFFTGTHYQVSEGNYNSISRTQSNYKITVDEAGNAQYEIVANRQ